jgi:hypothetical protein
MPTQGRPESSQRHDSTQQITSPVDPWHNGGALPVQEDIIRSFLASYSRDPFQRQLAKLLGCSPDREAVQKFANRNPDRWARCIQIFASLSGYTEKIEVEHNFNIDSMSDAEVERRLSEIEDLLKGTETISVTGQIADSKETRPQGFSENEGS